jgi:prefoldin subunit 5
MAVVFSIRSPRQEDYQTDNDALRGEITELAQTVRNLAQQVQQLEVRLRQATSGVTVPTNGSAG